MGKVNAELESVVRGRDVLVVLAAGSLSRRSSLFRRGLGRALSGLRRRRVRRLDRPDLVYRLATLLTGRPSTGDCLRRPDGVLRLPRFHLERRDPLR